MGRIEKGQVELVKILARNFRSLRAVASHAWALSVALKFMLTKVGVTEAANYRTQANYPVLNCTWSLVSERVLKIVLLIAMVQSDSISKIQSLDSTLLLDMLRNSEHADASIWLREMLSQSTLGCSLNDVLWEKMQLLFVCPFDGRSLVAFWAFSLYIQPILSDCCLAERDQQCFTSSH